jgi:hypothetical protein
MPNMSYCRYENTSLDMQDVVDTLFDTDLDIDLSSSERRGLETILDLARDIIDMEDKINNIISNSYERITHEKY